MYNPKISKRKYIIAKQIVLSKIIKKHIFEKKSFTWGHLGFFIFIKLWRFNWMFEKYQFSCRKIQIFLDHLKQKMRLLLEISIFQIAVKIKINKKGISNTPMSLIFNLDTFHTNSYHLHTKTWPKLSVFIAKSYCLPQMPHCAV